MKVGTIIRRLLFGLIVPIAIGVAGVVLEGLDPENNARFWIVVGLVVALAVQGLESFVGSVQKSAAENEGRVLMSDQLGPLVNQVAEYQAVGASQRRTALSGVLQTALGATIGLTSASRTRATIFEVRPDPSGGGAHAFVPSSHSLGRGDAPVSVFERLDGGEGDEVWRAAASNEVIVCSDTRKTRRVPTGFDASRRRAYRAFVTVPIYAGADVAGLLTINAPKKRAFDSTDVATMRVLAALVGGVVAEAPVNTWTTVRVP